MDVELAILFFFVIAAVWLFLPFAPALCEFWGQTDVEPLRVVPEAEVDVHSFAHRYRRYVELHLAGPMARCQAEDQRQRGRLPDGTAYLVLPGAAESPLDGADSRNPCRTMLVSCGPLRLPPEHYLSEVYAAGPITGADSGVYRALLSDESVELGAGSRILRWLHARTGLRAGASSRFDGRVSAGERIELADGCRFERLNAPSIVFGADTPPPPAPVESARLDPSDLPRVIEVAAGRWLIRRRLDLPDAVRVEADLVVTGSATIGAGASIQGSVKSHGDLRLGTGVQVGGSVVSGRNLYLGAGCRIHGPILAEGAVQIQPGCRVGSPERPTTLSARQIRVAAGAVAHGTVWAHQTGSMMPPARGEV